MTYFSHTPSSPLNQFIYDLYYLEGSVPFVRQKVLPMPVAHMIINLGMGFKVTDSLSGTPIVECAESWCVGLWNRPYTVEWPRTVRLYGIHFRPAGAFAFLRHPFSELHNQILNAERLWGQAATSLREQLEHASTVGEAFACLESMLLARLGDDPIGLNIVRSSIGDIAQCHGMISIRALSHSHGVSQNHLGTLFKQMVGATPKELARFYRFAHVLQTVELCKKVEWTQIAHHANYYDQSHFNRDFISFTGHNPSEFLQLRQKYNLHNAHTDLNLGNLPLD